MGGVFCALISDSLAEARKNAESGITKFAIENYNAALALYPTEEVYAEVAEYYMQQKDGREYVTWCEDFLEKYPYSSLAFDCLIRGYMQDEVYDEVYDMLEEAEARGVSSSYMQEVRQQTYYMYSFGYTSYDDVGIFSNNYAAVKADDKWGFVTRFGELRISCKYLEVGVYTTQMNTAPVVNSQGVPYFIDKSGAKVLATNEEYLRFGNLIGDHIAAQKSDEKYTYLNAELKECFGEYDYAGAINNGVAAVLIDESWMLIDDKGNQIGDDVFDEIRMDEKTICYRRGRVFARIGEEWFMLDGSGNKIGTQSFADAKTFVDDSYAAVKIGEEWHFIDVNGNVKPEAYQNARSYSNGFAAVQIGGKWGFLDIDGNLVINNEFFDAKDFNEKGSCFVKTGDQWQLLKIYRLNREG